MQLEMEMNKFDISQDDLTQNQEKVEAKFQAQLQQFVVAPFADRLYSFIQDMFSQLNFSEAILEDLTKFKSKKKTCRRNQSASTSKQTPMKTSNGELSKSPASKRRKINDKVYVECQTQTEQFIA